MAGSCWVVRHNRVCDIPSVSHNTETVNGIAVRDAKYRIVDEPTAEISSHTTSLIVAGKHPEFWVDIIFRFLPFKLPLQFD